MGIWERRGKLGSRSDVLVFHFFGGHVETDADEWLY